MRRSHQRDGRSPARADRRMMDLINRDSPAGVELLYDRYGGVAYAVALRVLGDECTAETVVVEAFLSIWRRSPTIPPLRGAVAIWLHHIVRHHAIARLQAREGRPRREAVVRSLLGTETSAMRPAAPPPDGELVRRAIAALPDEQREAIELAYFGGCSATEIGGRTGVPVGTVRTGIRMAVRSLLATTQPVA